MLWTPRQRLGLSLLTTLILALTTYRYFQNLTRIPDPPPLTGARSHELPGKLDPNTATASALASLPSIGPKLAQRIIDERDAFQKDNPTRLPYEHPKDLLRVPGIGQAMLENITPYLSFPQLDPRADPAP